MGVDMAIVGLYVAVLVGMSLRGGKGMQDAADFAARTGAEKVVPLHWGLFDELSAEDFACANKIIPTPYREIDV